MKYKVIKLYEGFRKDKRVGIILTIAVMLQFFFLAYQNLFTMRDVLDNDMAKMFIHIAEIWKQKNIFIRDWLYEDLELGSPAVIAVFIYGVTHDIFVSFGIANIIFLLLCLYAINEFLKSVKFSSDAIKLAMLAFMTPYSYGQLLYPHMLYFGASYYVIRIVVPIMCLAFFLSDEDYLRKHKVHVALYLILLFITSAASATYVIAVGLLPIFITYWFMGCRRSKEKNMLIIASVVSAMAGVAVTVLAPVDYVGLDRSLTTPADFPGVISSLTECFLEMMGILPDQPASPMSLQGLGCVARGLFSVVLLAFLVAYCIKGIKAYINKRNGLRDQLSMYVTTLVAFNMFVVLMTGTASETRYLLISFCPLLVVFAAYIYDHLYIHRDIYTKVCLMAFFLVMLLLSDYIMAFGDPFPYSRGESVKYDEVAKILDQYPDKDVVFLNDTNMTEIFRARDLESGRRYLTYAAPGATDFGEGFVAVDYYTSFTGPDATGDDYLLVTSDYWGTLDDMPEYIRDNYEEIGAYQSFIVYKRRDA